MTLEEQYKQETGESPIYEGVNIYGAADGEYTKNFVEWIKWTLLSEIKNKDKLLSALTKRMEAGEELLSKLPREVFIADVTRIPEDEYVEIMSEEYSDWQQSIADHIRRWRDE